MWMILASAGAAAAPSAALCDRWGDDLSRQATALAGENHRLQSTNLQVDTAVVRFDTFSAQIEDGVCRVRARGNLDVAGQAQVSIYGIQSACKVRLSRAPVAARLDITGTSAAPKIKSSLADIEGLRSKMTLCVNLDVVKGLVVDIADDYIKRNKTQWHGAIEGALAR